MLRLDGLRFDSVAKRCGAIGEIMNECNIHITLAGQMAFDNAEHIEEAANRFEFPQRSEVNGFDIEANEGDEYSPPTVTLKWDVDLFNSVANYDDVKNAHGLETDLAWHFFPLTAQSMNQTEAACVVTGNTT